MVDGNGNRSLSVTEALVTFREASVVRGPTQEEFANAAGLAGQSSSQTLYAKLAEIGWIALLDPETPRRGYALTPAGERRYRELKPSRHERKGPSWPIE